MSNFGPKIDFFKNIFWTALHIFLIFCMKLDTNKTVLTTSMLPLGKLLPRPHRDQKVKFGPKLDFFKIILWTVCQIFFIFYMKLGTNKTRKTMFILPSGKLLPRPDGGQKVKFGLKMDFFKIIFWTPFQNFFCFTISCLDDWTVVAMGPVVHFPLFLLHNFCSDWRDVPLVAIVSWRFRTIFINDVFQKRNVSTLGKKEEFNYILS